ncbi:hypothetical protein AB0H45_26310 [Streptomyces atroolivaceus]|uniref:Uncharacterized protein n=1 Tax=Streptomyces atroolivaceus TaxID=66869 RepID=A0ABV9VH45_STRAZ|nr:hypothetical protein [Streptomyces atroolivaceus]
MRIDQADRKRRPTGVGPVEERGRAVGHSPASAGAGAGASR